MLQEKLEQVKKLNVEIIAVTKYARDEQVLKAYELGLRNFGENYVQVGLEKIKRLTPYFIHGEVEWHLLGKLQSNKVNKVVGNFHVIQSVDSEELAKKINRRAEELGLKQKIFLQINMTGDKNGFDPESSHGTLLKIFGLANLEVQGLMTMGFNLDQEKNFHKSETIYSKMRQLKRILESDLDALGLKTDLKLSMGMSSDYGIAVANGSTMIRLGRGLFAEEKFCEE